MLDSGGDDSTASDVVARVELPAEPASAGAARRFVRDFCARAGIPDELCQIAMLLVSELVTNAVIHGRTSATVEMHHATETMRVAVRDRNPQLPAVGESPNLDGQGGRGLHLVSALADRWGIEPAGDGKAVWFELILVRGVL